MGQLFFDESDNLSLEEVVRSNIKKASEVRKELAIYKDRDNSIYISPISDSFTTSDTSQCLDSSIDYSQEDYKYYYDNIIDSLINTNSLDDKRDAVISNLPCAENKNYSNIINRIKLEVLKNIYDLSITDTDLKNELFTLLALLDDASTYKINSDINNIKPVNNRLVFLDTVKGNVYAFKDLSGLEEAFPYFQGLLESIENGTFKGVKRFDNNSSLTGISEVRDYQARVIFDRIDKNTYIILQMFIKKTSKNSGYHNMLSNRIGYYRGVRERVKNQLSDENYLLAQEELRNSLMECLENKEIGKMKKLNRGDK